MPKVSIAGAALKSKTLEIPKTRAFTLMKKTILSLAICCAGFGASAGEWRIYDQVGTPSDAAMICHLWNATIFAPGETPSCMIGTLFTVDLETREIRYENSTPQGLSRNRADRDLTRSVLINSLKGEGVEKLERMRDELLAKRDEARAKAEAERARSEYLSAFRSANSLERIAAFETKYRDNDPDEMISKLSEVKEKLIYVKYRADYAAAKSSVELSKFASDYAEKDPDRLVQDAKKQIPQVQKQEQIAMQQAERKRLEEQRQQEKTARQASIDKDKNRLQYIQRLHSKYSGNIVADSPEGRRIMETFKIPCKVPDGRVLPLKHALYASMAQIDGMGGKMLMHIQNRGPNVRIYAETYKDGKPLGEPTLYYQLNEWGELRPVGIRSEAVLNACVGSQGPIWLMPGEPGY